MRLPRWSARDWRAMLALVATVAGAAVLTGLSMWLVATIAASGAGDRALALPALKALARSNYGLLVIIGTVLLSLGLAINRRSVKARAFGAEFEADGGARHPDERRADG
ncbi:hypothetical protein [Sphingomicrobium astaxanthinifaciens]|uniref:hypothetical protein n=1 Tax=Sphingomicrobium astaxanthinifaciens TaxID=1227949 RepID=UPI001FCBC148|nr:hypothetical protein [Sphingomicrobium astaxanthinifaciens]MCJ7421486.1 hypothetical protein [Sphingomicrobium astaxanthinifaciens]